MYCVWFSAKNNIVGYAEMIYAKLKEMTVTYLTVFLWCALTKFPTIHMRTFIHTA